MENILLDMKDVYEIIKIAFENNQPAIFKVRGMSMFPLLKDKRDSVKLESIVEDPKKKDIILYKRDNGQFVLHRIIKVKDGLYTLVGDNQHVKEYPIRRDQILGVVTSIIRKGKEIDLNKSFFYKMYSFFWCFNLFIRRVILKIMHTVNKNSYLHE
jgi:hypothetical protein